MFDVRLNERELLLFDLDGTLVDSAADLHQAMNLSLEQLNLPKITIEQVRVWIGKGSSIFCQSTLQFLTGQVDEQQHQDLLATFLKIYDENPCEKTIPFSGVKTFLEWGLEHHKKMICVTNKPEQPAIKIIEALALSNYFVDIVGGDRFEQRKPHPRQLWACMDRFAISSNKTLMIGDSSNDVDAARAAGVDCIVVSYGYNHGEDIRYCQPQYIVDDLRELLG